jgi:CheY-like chemotaxis protein
LPARSPRPCLGLPVQSLQWDFVVVDEEEMLPRLLERFLPEVDVEVAPDTASAVESLRRSPAQALIVNTPPFTPSTHEVFGNLPFDTPVITCWLPGERAAAKRLGVMEYLIKPLTREKLLTSLARLGSTVKTILVVDDEEDELQLFARMLATHNPHYSILQVTSGQRALSMLRSRQPDLMLLDLMMPGMNGFQVLAEKANDPAIAPIPTMIVSSRDPVGDPLLGNTLTVTQNAGFSQRHLIACIHALGGILVPPVTKGTYRDSK